MALTTPSTMPTAMDEQGTAADYADYDLEMALSCIFPLSKEAFLHFFIVYCCFTCIIGIICNAVVLWSVARCPRTITPVKAILCAIFFCTLLTCIVQPPIMAHITLTALHCAPFNFVVIAHEIIKSLGTLNRMEIFYITVMALLRARAVWAPWRGPVRQCTAVAVLVGVGLYNAVATEVKELSDMMDNDERLKYDVTTAFTVVHYFLPVLLTLACYLSTIVAVRRNKRNLAGGQHTAAVTQVMDDATRAMLAVFISNMVFVLPYSFKYMLDGDIFIKYTTEIFFYTHLFADPLVFVCFNKHHRRRVLKALKFCLGRPPREEDVLTLEARAAQPSTALGVQTKTQAKIQEDTC